ncbi:MAG: toll/interleukin-1 receptor domain-containing protein [Actinomycetota bacterium]|nr:toll/interleukin-1 receptor domain-containing protein [Actinomycetota bacterium]
MDPEVTAQDLRGWYEEGDRSFQMLALDGADLSGADLRDSAFYGCSFANADFSSAILTGARFEHTDLVGANLYGAALSGATFFRAALTNVDLRAADCNEAMFLGVPCQGADLRWAKFVFSVFANVDSTGARFDHTRVAGVSFCNVDIGSFCEATSMVHGSPSFVDAQTVMQSYRHPRLKSFMIDCGVPELFAEYMIDCARALGEDALRELMQSTFISYGGPDEAFSRRLYDALRAHGVVVFFFPETARVGERIGDEVFNALQRHDRMILVCSRTSLDRPGVLNEIQETLDREARDGGATYLIPVMLDSYLLEEWSEKQPVLAKRVKSRVAADFRDSGSFDAALARLLAALRKKTPKTT